jgi:hypothetical protein
MTIVSYSGTDVKDAQQGQSRRIYQSNSILKGCQDCLGIMSRIDPISSDVEIQQPYQFDYHVETNLRLHSANPQNI